MKKFLPVALVVLVLAIAGYFYFGKSKGGTMMGDTPAGMKSLKELITSGVSQKCTFSVTGESGVSEGTNYVSGGNVRGDFTNTYQGKETVSHMISDGKTSYVWTEGEKTGYKMSVSEETKESQDGTTDDTMGNEANLDQKMDYNCSSWVPDNSLFSPPSDVTFTDLSEMMMQETSSESPSMMEDTSSQCSYCDSLSGDSKTQCLSALNCQ